MGGSKTYPYGSTSTVRGQVLAVLGVLKVATPDQMHRLMAPGHQGNKAFRNACLDLARHGLTVSEGNARDGNKLWGLTPLGLDAAAEVLGRRAGEMGSTARGAARSGAPHAMAVNETIIAITRTPPEPTRPVPRRHTTDMPAAPAASSAAPDGEEPAAGIGNVAAWSTEVALHLPTTGRNRSGVRADAVLSAAQDGVPVLVVEVDNCTEPADVLAAKFDKYHRFFRLKTKDPHGRDTPVWRTLYPSTGREGHPPVAVVFNPGRRIGEQALKNRMNQVMDITRPIWSGTYHAGSHYSRERDGYYDYGDAIPILFTTLDLLKQHGPRATVWQRCGHGQWENLDDALANPQDINVWREREQRRRRMYEERWAKEQAIRERELAARREEMRREEALWPAPEPVPPCERCGRPITGEYGFLYEDAPPEDGKHCQIGRAHV